jgi:hypothetical protein
VKCLPFISLVAAVSLLGVGCGTEGEPTASEEAEVVIQPEFEGSLWRLVALQAESGDMTAVLAQTTVDVTFEGGTLVAIASERRID